MRTSLDAVSGSAKVITDRQPKLSKMDRLEGIQMKISRALDFSQSIQKPEKWICKVDTGTIQIQLKYMALGIAFGKDVGIV
jgi:hypothetical protein